MDIAVISAYAGLGVVALGFVAKYVNDRRTLAENKKNIDKITTVLEGIKSDTEEAKRDTKEGNRLIQAVHGRLDRVEKSQVEQALDVRAHDVEIAHLKEFYNQIRQTQRFTPVSKDQE